jgi:hypothetical protein
VACDMPSAKRFHDQRLCRGGAGGTPHDQRPYQGRPCGSQGARRQARRLTARNQRNAPGGRARASTGHCADTLGIDRHVGPCRGCRVECAPGRNAKRCTMVCQDRYPCARAANIDCALGAGPGDHPLPDTHRRPACPPRRPLPRRWAVVSCLPIQIPSLIPRTRARLNAVGQDRLTVSGDPERRRFDCECH